MPSMFPRATLAIALTAALIAPAAWAQTSEAPLSVIGLGTSTVRDAYHPAGYLIDGNMASAWAPAPSDMAPHVTLSLPVGARLHSLALKLSPPGVRVDVAVATPSRGFHTIATGLVPAAETLSRLPLTPSDATQVRLSFSGAIATLKVCEVQLFGSPLTSVPTPTPTWTPSPAPTVVPTPTPTWSPVPAPGAVQPKAKGKHRGHGKGQQKGRGKGHQKHH